MVDTTYISGKTALSLAAGALAQLSSVTFMAATATNVLVLIVMSSVPPVLTRDDPSPSSAELIVAICPTSLQCLCFKHI